MKSVRVGVLGAGHWAVENHIPVLQSFEGVEVAGICRLGKDEIKHICDRFKISIGTEDYRQILPSLGWTEWSSAHHNDLHSSNRWRPCRRISLCCVKSPWRCMRKMRAALNR